MTLTSAIKLALVVLGLVRDFLGFVERRQIADDATKAMAADLREKIDASIKAAEDARARVRADINTDPGKLRDPTDPFRRPD